MLRLSRNFLDGFSRALPVLFWLVSLIAAGLWLFVDPAPEWLDKLAGLLGVIGVGLIAVLKSVRSKLEDEEFSAPFALAFGYTQFLKRMVEAINSSGCVQCLPKIYVFIPNGFSDLSDAATQAVQKKIEAANFEVESFVAANQAIHNILRNQVNTGVFYDFPRTLNTLREWIEYKLPQEGNSFGCRGEREALENTYISHFRDKLEELLAREGIGDYIAFTGTDLEFLNEL